MFETAVVAGGRTARPVTVSISAVAQVAIVASGLLYFALRIEPLPKVELRALRDIAVVVEVRREREPRQAPVQSEHRVNLPVRRFQAPRTFSANASPSSPELNLDVPVIGDPSPSGPGGPPAPAWTTTNARPTPPPDPPKPAPAAAAPKAPSGPVTVGGDVRAPRLLREVKPVYPQLARQARVQGTVVIEAIISRDGAVRSARIAGGHPLLVNAALDAVRQWVYSPTTLNGQSVEVILLAEVNFRLSQ